MTRSGRRWRGSSIKKKTRLVRRVRWFLGKDVKKKKKKDRLLSANPPESSSMFLVAFDICPNATCLGFWLEGSLSSCFRPLLRALVRDLRWRLFALRANCGDAICRDVPKRLAGS